jgi:hypothetical protein
MEEKTEAKKIKKKELLFGLLIAFFAALLAVVDLGSGKFGDDQMVAVNEKSAAYQWYQAKSIKQTLVEGEMNMLKSLIDAKAIAPDDTAALLAHTIGLQKNIKRYNKEKKEIMVGSSQILKEDWAQDVNGVMGVVIGAKEWETKANALDKAGDSFDLGTLFLQICLVMGAIGLVSQNAKSKNLFLFAMIFLGCLGIFFGIKAFILAWAV